MKSLKQLIDAEHEAFARYIDAVNTLQKAPGSMTIKEYGELQEMFKYTKERHLEAREELYYEIKNYTLPVTNK